MILDPRELEDSPSLESDICIIDSRKPGMNLAFQLERAASSVLLRGGGGLVTDRGARFLAGRDGLGWRCRQVDAVRLCHLGDSSNPWHSRCGEFDAYRMRAPKEGSNGAGPA
jgi:hypothetical protein